jgi:hypothetical protein
MRGHYFYIQCLVNKVAGESQLSDARCRVGHTVGSKIDVPTSGNPYLLWVLAQQ